MGTIGDVGLFSMHPRKNFHVYGDGGLIVTNDTKLYTKLKLLRKDQLEKKLKIKFNKKNFLIIIHPETQTNNSEILLKNTLDCIKLFKDTNLFFTGIGADFESVNLSKITKKFVSKKIFYL